MKILQHIRLHVKNNITQIAHYNSFEILRYVHLRYIKCLFANIQKQQNTFKINPVFKKNTNFKGK